MSIKKLQNLIDEFAKERDWDKFHTPSNLAKSISIEAAELLECFQWKEEGNIDEIKEELADVLNYCLRLASVLNLDVEDIVIKKMEKTAIKYPIKKCYGKSDKYNKL